MRAAHILFVALCPLSAARTQDAVTRVFVFAGQSNMVGSDSHVEDVRRFPPFAGLEAPQPEVRFSYVLGREDRTRSDGWVDLQPVDGVVGPELSFAREVREHVDAPLAIIKVAAGGTHLGGDWNPDAPSGFEMYPLLLDTVRTSLAALDREGVRYRLEGFVWHQGENDMFDEGYQASYGANLANFVASVRRDLGAPELRFYLGELCTKTVWGMDLRPRMHAISVGQRAVAAADPRVDYVPTSHIGVEIGQPYGLHYHYGTLGQLEHGVEHARAHLANIGVAPETRAPLATWPLAKGSKVRLFVLAGHRNMEGERAFVQELVDLQGGAALCEPDTRVPFKYSTAGGVQTSNGWEPLGPAGLYDTFGPEISFGATLRRELDAPFALAKFTHSGSQIIDWTPEGSVAVTRNLYPAFLTFVREAIAELEARGHSVELAGVLYHVGENDMSFGPFRRAAAAQVRALIEASRRDLGLPDLRWFVSQQPPTEHAELDSIDVTAALAQLAAEDPRCVHVKVFDLPPQAELLVLDTPGVIALGERLARAVLAAKGDLRHSSRAPAGAEQLVGDEGHVLVPAPDGPSGWRFADGVLTASPGWDSVVTPKSYSDFRLHVEFNVNAAANEAREKNGNSGVYLQERYEVQILDSHGVAYDDYQDWDCGSLYRLRRPDRNVCAPAGEWQTLDIVFRAARFEGARKVEDARITVSQNGELIHDDVALPRKTGAGAPEGPEPRPIKLQGHQNKVRFRNVWIEALAPDAEIPFAPAFAPAQEPLTLNEGDTVALVGNTFVEREQRDGWLELALTLTAPELNVTVRNLGWSGDTVEGRARRFFGSNQDGFQHLLDHVDLVRPTVVLVSYGASEAFDGSQAADPGPARASFIAGYGRLLDALAQRGPRIVIVSAPPLEASRSPAPELARRVNAELGWQAGRLRELALERGIGFVDLFSPLSKLVASDDSPGALTDNGVHLTSLGYQIVTREVLAQLGLGAAPWGPSPTRTPSPEIEGLRAAIRAKNEVFFHRHRPQNETYLRGFRRNEQGRHATEIEAFGPLTLEHDRAVFALRAAAVHGEASR